MSTVMYCFKASNQEVLDRQIEEMKKLSEDLFFAGEDGGIDIQIFNTSIGIVYRILECEYGLKNQMYLSQML